ncbi:Predicted glycosyl hydrolase, GH43/DUF377 family [Mucilaginibacter pineti]|uniref:Predicted glycosyl hydrolase, GH43/DUF377 family n=1 Tax=Mucilaginibacter pineti TaxID=1391627 RepID=A0A1G6WYN9_9SPHI|nr:glycoside hydrolase family 130 protein [Mucilaginibacter pineti]SDD71080.1 Predicted glycosyl hydrolase, GH43/DUF377 family [Mucilaginibacter pineti]
MKPFLYFVKTITLLLVLSAPTFAQQDSVNHLPDWAFGGFKRTAGVNPIISPDSTSRFFDPILKKAVAWESNDTFNPAAALYKGKVVVLYRSEDKSGVGIGFRTSRLGYASSSDGYHFKRSKTPVFYPADDTQKKYEWPGGCEDPRVAVTQNGTYVVFYTQWNRDNPRLGVATSKDLKHWIKHGPIFEDAFNGKFLNIPHKSASILTRISNGKQVITKINGKYWMYWGEQHVYAATSANLVDWQPVVNNDGSLKELISPRKGYFDSSLTECGPPALLTKKGIILFYNGKNSAGDDADSRFTKNSYCAGQVLFDKNDPAKPIARLNVPFLRPLAAFEKSGQYVNGTVFIEGMVYFHNKWFMYYGCADSRVAVAVYDPAKPSLPDPIR